MQFSIAGLTPGPSSDPRVVTFATAGGVLAFGAPPLNDDGSIPQETHVAGVPVRKVLEALGAMELAQRRAEGDASLSDLGRARAVEPAKQALVTAYAAATAEVEELARNAVSFAEKVFEVPKLEPSDFVAALADREVRDHLRGLTDQQRRDLGASIGEQPRLLLAVLRSPLPIPWLSDQAESAWRSNVAKTHPRAAELDRFQRATAWATEALPAIGRFIPRPAQQASRAA